MADIDLWWFQLQVGLIAGLLLQFTMGSSGANTPLRQARRLPLSNNSHMFPQALTQIGPASRLVNSPPLPCHIGDTFIAFGGNMIKEVHLTSLNSLHSCLDLLLSTKEHTDI